MNNQIIRVFPRRTKASPVDDLVYFGEPPVLMPNADEVHVSCTFIWDRPRAEYLADQWSAQHPNVKLGGPAYDDSGGEFVAGRYLKPGYTITSRGCNSKCRFCYVPKREGHLRELPIVSGWNILDNNLLQCSKRHVLAVFRMLKKQQRRAQFTGGLDTRFLTDRHVELLVDLKPKQFFLAYDTLNSYNALVAASKKLIKSGLFTAVSHTARCYVLIGFAGDTTDKAESRLQQVIDLGFMPMAMLYRPDNGRATTDWRQFQRIWSRPKIISSLMTEVNNGYGNTTGN